MTGIRNDMPSHFSLRCVFFFFTFSVTKSICLLRSDKRKLLVRLIFFHLRKITHTNMARIPSLHWCYYVVCEDTFCFLVCFLFLFNILHSLHNNTLNRTNCKLIALKLNTFSKQKLQIFFSSHRSKIFYNIQVWFNISFGTNLCCICWQLEPSLTLWAQEMHRVWNHTPVIC